MAHYTNGCAGWPANFSVSSQLHRHVSCRRRVRGGSGTNGGS